MPPKKRNIPFAPSNDRTMVLVLGVHRSGTSALAGLLHTVGYATPKTLMPATERNPKGHFESQTIVEFNERLLRDAGSTWKDWRTVNPSWFTSKTGRAAQAQALLASEFQDAPHVVLKDPRICKMVPFWVGAAEAAGFRVLPVLTRRHPLEVTQSLQARDGIVPAEGMLIWLCHMLSAEFATRKMPRFLTTYDKVVNNGLSQITEMSKTFGVGTPNVSASTRKKVKSFLSPSLKHFYAGADDIVEDKNIPHWVCTTHDIFERWSRDGEARADYGVLDRIRRELDKAAPIFAQVVGQQKDALNDRTRQLKTAHERLQMNQAEIKLLKAEAGTKTKQIEHHEKNQRQLSNDLQTAKKHADDLQVEISEFSRILANRQAQIMQINQDRNTLRSELDVHFTQLEKQQSDYRKLTFNTTDAKNRLSVLSPNNENLEHKTAELQQQLDAKHKDLQYMTTAFHEERKLVHEGIIQVQKTSAEALVARTELQAEMLRSEALQERLDQSEQDFEVLQAKFRTLQGDLSTKESALIQRQLETEETLKRAQVAEHSLNETDTYLRDLLNLLREMHGLDAVQEYTNDLGSWPDVVGGLKTEIAVLSKSVFSAYDISENDNEKSGQTVTLSARVSSLDRALTVRTKELEDARQAHNIQMAELLAKMDETHRNNKQQISDAQTALTAIENSTFWRMTKPLRRVVDMLRGAR